MFILTLRRQRSGGWQLEARPRQILHETYLEKTLPEWLK
jgi:hypothetical protein